MKTQDTKSKKDATPESHKDEEKTKKLESEIIELKTALEEANNRWKRALADYQNLQKRTESQQFELVQFAVKNFLEKLLGVFDDIEKAQAHLNDKGLELALKKLQEVLKNEGLERIETLGKDYDIETMEAISIDDGKEDNKVIAEHRSGYLMHGSVLRPAQVTVSKKNV